MQRVLEDGIEKEKLTMGFRPHNLVSTSISITQTYSYYLQQEVPDYIMLLQQRNSSHTRIIDNEIMTSSCRRLVHEYRPGDKVLKLRYKLNSHNKQKILVADGPFPIEQVNPNDGRITIRLGPNVVEHLPKTRVKPYRRRTAIASPI